MLFRSVEDGNMCAAIAPDGSELVIVAQNFGNARSATVDLGKFTGIKTAEIYRTSDRENCQKMAYPQDVSDHVLDVDLPKNSVTTYVMKAEAGKDVCDMSSSVQTVDADVVKGAEWASATNKFAYTGKWRESGDCDGKYTTESAAAATFTFEGERALIYGTNVIPRKYLWMEGMYRKCPLRELAKIQMRCCLIRENLQKAHIR